jgi:hypothetical protein
MRITFAAASRLFASVREGLDQANADEGEEPCRG